MIRNKKLVRMVEEELLPGNDYSCVELLGTHQANMIETKITVKALISHQDGEVIIVESSTESKNL